MKDAKAGRCTATLAMCAGFIALVVNAPRSLDADQWVAFSVFIAGAVAYFVIEIVN